MQCLENSWPVSATFKENYIYKRTDELWKADDWEGMYYRKRAFWMLFNVLSLMMVLLHFKACYTEHAKIWCYRIRLAEIWLYCFFPKIPQFRLWQTTDRRRQQRNWKMRGRVRTCAPLCRNERMLEPQHSGVPTARTATSDSTGLDSDQYFFT